MYDILMRVDEDWVLLTIDIPTFQQAEEIAHNMRENEEVGNALIRIVETGKDE